MQKSHLSVFSGFFAAVAASALAAFGADPSPRSLSGGESDIALCGFENFSVGQAPTAASGWTVQSADDAEVAAYSAGEGFSGSAPKPFTGVGDNYLKVDSSDEVTLTLSEPSSAAVTYIDTVVQIPAVLTEPDATAFDNDDAKLALWFSADENGTNLCVRGAKFTSATTTEPATFKFALSNVTGSWHRVTIGAYASIAPAGAAFAIPAFDVQFDGTYLFTDSEPCDSGVTVSVDEEYAGDFEDGIYVPAIGCSGAAGSISSVGFTGTGAVDDVVVTTIDPAKFMVSWPTELTSVTVTTNGVAVANVTPSAGSVTLNLPGNVPVVVTGSVGYQTVTATGNSLTANSVSLPAFGATYYFANGSGTSESPFEIATPSDLFALKDAVADNVGSARSACYVQTADIDMASAGAFAGIGTYNASPTGGTPFTGTYDGGNYKIMNVDFTQRNYGGVFNQVNGGTIKNLTVSNITCNAFSASVNEGEWGGAIVGNAGNGATLTNLVAEGTFAADHTATHNVAGIVIRASAGGTGTLIKDCTNNATLYGSYTKIGGICSITQSKIAGGVVTFDGCVNNGDIHRVGEAITTTASTPSANSANGGFGGIVGYTADDTVVVNCSNSGTISVPAGSTVARVGEIVGWGSSKTLVDQGGNSGDAAKKLLGSTGATVTGFQYATVENGVATTLDPPYTLAEGETYLLEGNATPSFALAAAGDTITFDTALGYTLTDTGITVASGLVLEHSVKDTWSIYKSRPLATPTVTVIGGANATAAWTVNGEPVPSAPATLVEGDTYAVVYTANEGFEFAEGATTSAGGTAGTEDISITISDAVAQGGSALDPENGTLEVTVDAESESAAIAAAKEAIAVPSGSSVGKAVYAEYFTYDATGEGGTYTVTITGIKDTVTAGVYESALDRLTDDSTAAIAVPAGLYYSITPSTALPISGTPATGLSTGSVPVAKPGTTAGFYEIKLSPTSFDAQ